MGATLNHKVEGADRAGSCSHPQAPLECGTHRRAGASPSPSVGGRGSRRADPGDRLPLRCAARQEPALPVRDPATATELSKSKERPTGGAAPMGVLAVGRRRGAAGQAVACAGAGSVVKGVSRPVPTGRLHAASRTGERWPAAPRRRPGAPVPSTPTMRLPLRKFRARCQKARGEPPTTRQHHAPRLVMPGHYELASAAS